MKPMSDKRRAQLAAEGVLYPYSTLLPRSAKKAPEAEALPPELRRRATKKAPRPTGPDKLTVETVWERDFGRCALCGEPITGERAWDWSASHRRPRRDESDMRPDTNLPSNLVLLHGHALSLCHFKVESQRAKSYDSGQLLHRDAIPSQVAIEHAVHGRVFLTDDGDWSVTRPEVAA